MDLDEAMKVPKHNGKRKEEHIDGISNEVTQHLQNLAGTYPTRQCAKGSDSPIVLPILGGFVTKEQEENIADQCRRRESG